MVFSEHDSDFYALDKQVGETRCYFFLSCPTPNSSLFSCLLLSCLLTIYLWEMYHCKVEFSVLKWSCLMQQLNKEAANFDWTKSRGHTLSGGAHFEQYDEEFEPSSNVTLSQKVGGQVSVLPTARSASVNAAFARLASTSTPLSGSSGVH